MADTFSGMEEKGFVCAEAAYGKCGKHLKIAQSSPFNFLLTSNFMLCQALSWIGPNVLDISPNLTHQKITH